MTECLLCSKPIAETKRGRPQRFCCDAHRKAHSRLNGHEDCRNALSPIPHKRTSEKGGNTRGSEGQKSSISAYRADSGKIEFEQINEVTIKVTDGKQVRLEGALEAPGHIGSRALGWLMNVGWTSRRAKWVACVGNHRSEPLALDDAKRAAVQLLGLKGRGKERDLIAELNDYAAEAILDDRPLINISDDPPVTADEWRYIVGVESCLENGLINGIFETEAEFQQYRRDLKAHQGDPGKI
jgi:hypothetical protein